MSIMSLLTNLMWPFWIKVLISMYSIPIVGILLTILRNVSYIALNFLYYLVLVFNNGVYV